ncbi:PREDICTED: chromodomain-helicase-DNA-binding protein Mi-2 homolog isoform X2 [Ipomoea nil]|uniref:chromodomain-helicase-DNA-binding protein Mi-2 homolog isoform X2 n=1 Tax=Ipomoea nil TaxID=35883 RepID=UPI0009017C10|nr:PREDICTED: chromodomain-helicase-DNA-binding protein Mi-2 homolog isoform X2 [Ipomoea nil]
MNSQLGSPKYHEKEDHGNDGIVHVVSRKRKLSGREFKKLLVSRVKRVKAIDHAHGKQDRLSESGCSVSGTNEPSVTNMRVAESSCSNSKEERLDDSLQECTSTCNLQDKINTKSLPDLDLKLTNPEACDVQYINSKQDNEIGSEHSKCLICSKGGKLLCCAGKGCGRKFHLPCVDPPLTYFPLGAWYCIWCVKKKMELGVHAVSEGVESILDSRGADCENEVMHKQKQIQKEYLVKYKGLAHIHNRWIPEAELTLEASTLLARFNKHNKNVSWKTDWTMPHRLLEKRLLLLPESSETDSLGHNDNGSNCRYEWLVKWTGLDYDQATWELDTAPCLNSSKALKMISDYESHHKKANPEVHPSKNDKDKGSRSPLPELLTFPFEFTAQVHSNHLIYVNKLLKYWRTSENAVVIDSQERILKIVLLISSFARDMRRPFLIITTRPALSYWEDEFSRCASSINALVYKGNEDVRAVIRTLEFYNVQGAIMFQVLISHCNAVVEDIEMLKSISWEAIIIDTSQQSSSVRNYFEHIKVLATDKKLLLFRQIEDRRFSYRKFLSLLDSEYEDANSDFPESGAYTEDIKFKERFTKYIAYECKSSMSKFVEYWVPVRLSDVQTEQYCDCLLSNSPLLCSSLKCSLHDLLMSTRKCCDHPYLVDCTLRKSMVEGIPADDQLDVEIELSGKLQLLNRILFEIRKRGLRVLILYQKDGLLFTCQSFAASGGISIGDILDDFIHLKFGIDSHARICGNVSAPMRRTILNKFNNKESGKFVILMETRACVPSIKLSAIDTVVLFDSDWDPMNDFRALQKMTIDSKFEQLKVFRLYSSCTIEEKTLILAKRGLSVDSNIKRLKQTTCHELLAWGASYLFNKHDDCHHNISSKALLDDVFSELLNLLPSSSENSGSANCFRILKVQQNAGAYPQNITLPGELEMQSREDSSIISGLLDNEHASLFWMNLLEGRHSRRKYLSNPSQRVRKQHCLLDGLHESSERDEAGIQKANAVTVPDSCQFQADGIEANVTGTKTTITNNEQDQINCVDAHSCQFQAPKSFPLEDSNQPLASSVQQSAGNLSIPLSAVQADGMETNGTTPRSINNQEDFGNNNPIESSGIADVPQSHFLDPLQREMDKIQKEREQTMKLHEDLKLFLRSEFEKELLEIRKKYDLLLQNVEMEIVQKLKECNGCYDRVHLNKLLAEFMIEKRNANDTANSQEIEKESLASQPVIDSPLNPSSDIMRAPTTNPKHVNSDHATNHPSAVQHTANLQISSVGLPRSGTLFGNPILQPELQSVVPQTAGHPLSSVSLQFSGQNPLLSVMSELSAGPQTSPQVTPVSSPAVGATSPNPELAATIESFANLQPELLLASQGTDAPCATSTLPEQLVTPTSYYPRPFSCITATSFSGSLQVGCEIRAPAPHLRHLRPTAAILRSVADSINL